MSYDSYVNEQELALNRKIGWDIIFHSPGEIQGTFECKICGSDMEVRRSEKVVEPFFRGGRKREKDVFLCPNSGLPWHNQVCKLMEEINRCPSSRLCDIMQEEVEQILKQKEPTKKGFDTRNLLSRSTNL